MRGAERVKVFCGLGGFLVSFVDLVVMMILGDEDDNGDTEE